MLLLRVGSLRQAEEWQYEIKLDGYRAIAFKTSGQIHLRSRNNKDFASRYPTIAQALSPIPDETILDGEIVAFDPSGHPSFNALQNYGSSKTPIYFYAFDLLMLFGRDIRSETLRNRRELLCTKVLPKLGEPIRYSAELKGSLQDLIHSAREQRLEGLVAKLRNSCYESGKRSGAWRKMRINQGQEFVIGGYTLTAKNFDALIFGYYQGGQLLYAGRTRNGFTPALRKALFRNFKGLHTQSCPFANLPEVTSGRWGQRLTAAKMKECRWLKPVLVGQFEFTEWTPENHLRHSKFIALREDKDPQGVTKES